MLQVFGLMWLRGTVYSCMEGRLVSSSLAVPPFLQIDYYFL